MSAKDYYANMGTRLSRRRSTYGVKGRPTFAHYKKVLSRMRIRANTKVHKFKTKLLQGVVSGVPANDTHFAFNFQIGYLPDVAAFGAIFDSYRITKVRCDFYPIYTSTDGSIAPVNTRGECIYTVIDLDDSSVLASESDYLQYDTCRVHPTTCTHFSRTFVPRTAQAVFGGVTTKYAEQKGAWQDLASTNVEYYGLKFMLPKNYAGSNAVQCKMITTLFYEMKSQR